MGHDILLKQVDGFRNRKKGKSRDIGRALSKRIFCIWSSQLLSRTVVKRESILRSTREEEKSLSPEYLGTSTPGREVVEPKDPNGQSHSTTSASKSTVITCRPSEAALEEFRLSAKHENLAGPDFGKVLAGEDDDTDSR